jgi:FlaG/FlaF family flagellin (archaellin)
MNKLISLVAAITFTLAGTAYAADDKPAAEKRPTAQQTKMKECNAQAGDKALKGDERKAFMKECLSAKSEKSATQQDKMKVCNKEAGDKALKGDERKAFMSNCLKGEKQ